MSEPCEAEQEALLKYLETIDEARAKFYAAAKERDMLLVLLKERERQLADIIAARDAIENELREELANWERVGTKQDCLITELDRRLTESQAANRFERAEWSTLYNQLSGDTYGSYSSADLKRVVAQAVREHQQLADSNAARDADLRAFESGAQAQAQVVQTLRRELDAAQLAFNNQFDAHMRSKSAHEYDARKNANAIGKLQRENAELRGWLRDFIGAATTLGCAYDEWIGVDSSNDMDIAYERLDALVARLAPLVAANEDGARGEEEAK